MNENMKNTQEKAFSNYDGNRLHLRFKNGNAISIVWKWGNYCENQEKWPDFKQPMVDFREPSDDVEIMLLKEPSEKAGKKILAVFGESQQTGTDVGGPFGYVSLEQLTEVLSILSTDKPKPPMPPRLIKGKKIKKYSTRGTTHTFDLVERIRCLFRGHCFMSPDAKVPGWCGDCGKTEKIL
jgi:hypothetical protein